MKKVLSILGIFTISLALVGCQAFQSPSDTTPDVTDKEVAGELSTAEQKASVTITEDGESTAEQKASVTITEGDEEGTAEQKASVTITEGDEEGTSEQKASVTITEAE